MPTEPMPVKSGPALVAGDRLADVPRHRPISGGERLGLGLDVIISSAIFGLWDQPIRWSVLAALGPLTHRVRLGLMVGANTFRNPGVTTKLATTLDHVSEGRAILGSGLPARSRARRVRDPVRRHPGRAHRLAG